MKVTRRDGMVIHVMVVGRPGAWQVRSVRFCPDGQLEYAAGRTFAQAKNAKRAALQQARWEADPVYVWDRPRKGDAA